MSGTSQNKQQKFTFASFIFWKGWNFEFSEVRLLLPLASILQFINSLISNRLSTD